MERFQANKYLTKRGKCELAKSLNLTEKRITNWYNNMRQMKVAAAAAAEGTSSQSARE